MKLVKLLRKNQLSKYDLTLWEQGKPNKIALRKRLFYKSELCTDRVFHAYINQTQASIYSWRHIGEMESLSYWEAEGKVVVNDASKVGCCVLTITRKIQGEELITFEDVRNLIKLTEYKDPIYAPPIFTITLLNQSREDRISNYDFRKLLAQALNKGLSYSRYRFSNICGFYNWFENATLKLKEQNK